MVVYVIIYKSKYILSAYLKLSWYPSRFFLECFHLRRSLLIGPVSDKLPDQNTLQSVLVPVSVVRDVDRGAARADPVGADRAGEPEGEPRDVRPLVTGGPRAALYVGGDVLRDVEQHHVVTCSMEIEAEK